MGKSKESPNQPFYLFIASVKMSSNFYIKMILLAEQNLIDIDNIIACGNQVIAIIKN